MKRKIRRIGIFIGVGLLAVILLQNLKSISLNFLFWEGNTPLILLIPLVFLVGLAVGWFLKSYRK